VNGLGSHPITERADANTNLGQVFTQPFQIYFKALAIRHFALDNAREGIMLFGFNCQFQLCN
jgi:hypothetical protein